MEGKSILYYLDSIVLMISVQYYGDWYHCIYYNIIVDYAWGALWYEHSIYRYYTLKRESKQYIFAGIEPVCCPLDLPYDLRPTLCLHDLTEQWKLNSTNLVCTNTPRELIQIDANSVLTSHLTFLTKYILMYIFTLHTHCPFKININQARIIKVCGLKSMLFCCKVPSTKYYIH